MSTNRKTIELDATGMAPGRLATKIATFLMGKHKVKYTPHIDFGDKVVITNCDKIVFTGKKMEQKLYRHHSNHPGGLKEKQAKIQMAESPEEVIRLTVAKMLPKNKLRDQRMIRLHFKKS